MNAAFHGCSFTYGEGFPVDQRPLYTYPHLVSRELDFEITNLAWPGNSNYKIFMQAARSLQQQQFDIVFCQWTAFNRLWLHPGPDCSFFASGKANEFRYRDLYLSSNETQKFSDMLQLLNHDYHNLLDLIDYCNILESLASVSKRKICHINGLVPWESDLVVKPAAVEILSKYSKDMLDSINRDNVETLSFFETLQDKFQLIKQSNWVNLFDSFVSNMIDFGPEGHHPGIKSHRLMADKILNHLL